MDSPNSPAQNPRCPPSDSKSHGYHHQAPKQPEEKVRLMCSYGGRIVSRPHDKCLRPYDKHLRYVGGDTRIVVVPRPSSLRQLSLFLSGALPINIRPFVLKYLIPEHDLDSLKSIINDGDVQLMIRENDRVTARLTSPLKPSRLRLFLFSCEPETGISVHDNNLEALVVVQNNKQIKSLADVNTVSAPLGVGTLLSGSLSSSPSMFSLPSLGVDDSGSRLKQQQCQREALDVIQNNKQIKSLADVNTVSAPLGVGTLLSGSLSSSPSMFSLPSLGVDDSGSRLKQQQCQREALDVVQNNKQIKSLADVNTVSGPLVVGTLPTESLSSSPSMFSLPSLGVDDSGSSLKQQQCQQEALAVVENNKQIKSLVELKQQQCQREALAVVENNKQIKSLAELKQQQCQLEASAVVKNNNLIKSLAELEQKQCQREALSVVEKNKQIKNLADANTVSVPLGVDTLPSGSLSSSSSMFSLASLGLDDSGSRLKQQQCQREEPFAQLNSAVTDDMMKKDDGCVVPSAALAPPVMVTCHNMNEVTGDARASELNPSMLQHVHARTSEAFSSLLSPNSAASESRIASRCSYLWQPFNLEEHANIGSEVCDDAKPAAAIQRDIKVDESGSSRFPTQVHQNQEMDQSVHSSQQVPLPIPCYYPVYAILPLVATHPVTVTPQSGTASTNYNNATPIVYTHTTASNPVVFPPFHFCPLQLNMSFAPPPHGFEHQSTANVVQNQSDTTPLSHHCQSMNPRP